MGASSPLSENTEDAEAGDENTMELELEGDDAFGAGEAADAEGTGIGADASEGAAEFVASAAPPLDFALFSLFECSFCLVPFD